MTKSSSAYMSGVITVDIPTQLVERLYCRSSTDCITF